MIFQVSNYYRERAPESSFISDIHFLVCRIKRSIKWETFSVDGHGIQLTGTGLANDSVMDIPGCRDRESNRDFRSKL